MQVPVDQINGTYNPEVPSLVLSLALFVTKQQPPPVQTDAGTGRRLPSEHAIPSHVAEDVIRDIADFIKR